VKIKGTCRACGREFLVQQLLESQGHCPWCGQPFQPEYTAVLVDALELAEAAGNNLENALEKIAGMRPSFVIDEDTLLASIEGSLDEIRRGERPRYP
jgi:DNA repair exonuclease SbcCD ATPase subunit